MTEEITETPVADLLPVVLRAMADEVSVHASITGDPITRENADLMRALANVKDRVGRLDAETLRAEGLAENMLVIAGVLDEWEAKSPKGSPAHDVVDTVRCVLPDFAS